VRNLSAVDLVEAAFDDFATQSPIEIDGPHVVVEHPEIGAGLAARRDAAHRLAQQTPTEAAAAPVGMDMQVVDVGAKARVTLGPDCDEAHVARDQHSVVLRHHREFAAPVRPPLSIERGPQRAVAEDAAIGRAPARGMQGRDGVGIGRCRRPDR
jgi:hypothetical protein